MWKSLALVLAGSLAGAVLGAALARSDVLAARDQGADLRAEHVELKKELDACRAASRNADGPILEGRSAEDEPQGGRHVGPGDHPGGSTVLDQGEAHAAEGQSSDTPTGAETDPAAEGSEEGEAAEDDVEALVPEWVPSEFRAEMERAARTMKAAGVFGERAQYVLRIQPIASRTFVAQQGNRPGAGRATPETLARHLLQEVSDAEREEVVSELWRVFEAENVVLGKIAKRSQEIIQRQVEGNQFEDSIVALELRSGKLFAVRRGQDPEIDRLMEELERLRLVRINTMSPYEPRER